MGMGMGAGTGLSAALSLAQQPQSLFLPPQVPLPGLSPGQQQMTSNGGTACSPVLEGEETEADASSAALGANGFALAPSLPVEPSSSFPAAQHRQQQNGLTEGQGCGDNAQPAAAYASRRPGPGHRHKGSADSISYVKDSEDGAGDRWVLERRRTAESGEVEVLEREVVAGGRI
jgi:hypothetical protein